MTSLERLLAETHRIQKISHDWEELRKQAEAAQRIGTSAWRDMLTPPQPIPEDRTRDAYELAIKRWTAAVQGAWGKAVDDLVACSAPAVRIRVTNRNQTFLTGLELKVHLEGSVRGLERQNIHGRLRRSDLGLPEAPRTWGPREQESFRGTIIFPSNLLPAPVRSESRQASLDWKNSGSVDITIRIPELRPRGIELLGPTDLILIVPIDWQGPVAGTWQLTAQGHHQVLEGASP